MTGPVVKLALSVTLACLKCHAKDCVHPWLNLSRKPARIAHHLVGPGFKQGHGIPALAGAGFAYQTTGIGPGLPFFVRWPLHPARASEACLSSLAYGIRAADALQTLTEADAERQAPTAPAAAEVISSTAGTRRASWREGGSISGDGGAVKKKER